MNPPPQSSPARGRRLRGSEGVIIRIPEGGRRAEIPVVEKETLLKVLNIANNPFLPKMNFDHLNYILSLLPMGAAEPPTNLPAIHFPAVQPQNAGSQSTLSTTSPSFPKLSRRFPAQPLAPGRIGACGFPGSAGSGRRRRHRRGRGPPVHTSGGSLLPFRRSAGRGAALPSVDFCGQGRREASFGTGRREPSEIPAGPRRSSPRR
jgi:hypothetical protein